MARSEAICIRTGPGKPSKARRAAFTQLIGFTGESIAQLRILGNVAQNSGQELYKRFEFGTVAAGARSTRITRPRNTKDRPMGGLHVSRRTGVDRTVWQQRSSRKPGRSSSWKCHFRRRDRLAYALSWRVF